MFYHAEPEDTDETDIEYFVDVNDDGLDPLAEEDRRAIDALEQENRLQEMIQKWGSVE